MSEQIQERMDKVSKTLGIMLDYLGLEATIKAEDKDGKIGLSVASEDAGRIIGRKGQALESLQLLINRMMQKGDADFPHILIDIDGYSRKPRERRRGERGEEGGEESGGERRGGERRGGRGPRGPRGPRSDRGGRDDYSSPRPSSAPGEDDAQEGDGENEEILRQQALDAAKEVKRWGDPVTLAAMNSHDRRIVHITLQDDKELKTESLGDGNLKRVVITLNAGGSAEEKTEI